MSPLPSRPDTNALYSGPVVDAHHHFWDLSKGCHPWLAPATGQTGLLARDQLPDDYLRAASGHNVVATVHIEAGWDANDPHGEVAWLDALKRPAGLATRYVAYAALAAPDIDETLGRHAATSELSAFVKFSAGSRIPHTVMPGRGSKWTTRSGGAVWQNWRHWACLSIC